jgi:uncharacterized protein YjbJ (UPF0337 family)
MADERTTTEKGEDNKIRGKADKLKGRVKDAAGGLTNDPGLQAEGKVDKAKGKLRDAAGDVQRKVGRHTDEPRP